MYVLASIYELYFVYFDFCTVIIICSEYFIISL